MDPNNQAPNQPPSTSQPAPTPIVNPTSYDTPGSSPKNNQTAPIDNKKGQILACKIILLLLCLPALLAVALTETKYNKAIASGDSVSTNKYWHNIKIYTIIGVIVGIPINFMLIANALAGGR